MEAKTLLDRFLQERHYRLFGQAVTNGYAACEAVMKGSPVFSLFPPGIEHRSYLLPIFVQQALMVIANTEDDFTYSITPNEAHNCHHLRLFVKARLTLTAHFMGRHQPRDAARKAVNRAALAARNMTLDLFDDQSADEIKNVTHLYGHLLHSGNVVPDLAVLAIPRGKQMGHLATPFALDIPKPQRVAVEEIVDTINLQPRKQVRDSDVEATG